MARSRRVKQKGSDRGTSTVLTLVDEDTPKYRESIMFAAIAVRQNRISVDDEVHILQMLGIPQAGRKRNRARDQYGYLKQNR